MGLRPNYIGCNYGLMLLADYLKANNLTLEQFGRRIDRSAATISRIARGLHKPDWPTMETIERATKGAVQPNDFKRGPERVAA